MFSHSWGPALYLTSSQSILGCCLGVIAISAQWRFHLSVPKVPTTWDLPNHSDGLSLYGLLLPLPSMLCSRWLAFGSTSTTSPFPSWGRLPCSPPSSLSGPILNATSSERPPLTHCSSVSLYYSLSYPAFISFIVFCPLHYIFTSMRADSVLLTAESTELSKKPDT